MEKSISAMINKLFHQFGKTIKPQLDEVSLTVKQMEILMFIGSREQRGKKTFQKDIEHAFGIRGSSVTSALNNLEKNKWIRRESVDYDARLKSIVYNENTYEAIRHMTYFFDQFDNLMKDTLTDAEFIVFCQCVEKLSKALEENNADNDVLLPAFPPPHRSVND